VDGHRLGVKYVYMCVNERIMLKLAFGYEYAYWAKLFQDIEEWRNLVNTAMSLRVP